MHGWMDGWMALCVWCMFVCVCGGAWAEGGCLDATCIIAEARIRRFRDTRKWVNSTDYVRHASAHFRVDAQLPSSVRMHTCIHTI